MRKHEFVLWMRRLRAEEKARLLERRRTAGSFNHTVENQLSRSKYLGNNYAFTYNQRSESRVLRKGDFVSPTPYTHLGVSMMGNGHYGFHYYNDIPQDWGRANDYGFVALYNPLEAQIWSGYSDCSSMRSNLWTLTQIALNNKVLSEFPSWDALTDAVEFRETASTLLDCSKRFLEAAKGVVSRDPHRFFSAFGMKPSRRRVKTFNKIWLYHYGDSRSTSNVISGFSDLWLTYRYGIMPTIYSMEDCMKALMGPSAASAFEYSTQVTLTDTFSTTARYPSSSGWSGVTLYSRYTRFNKGSVRMRAKYSFVDSVKNRIASSIPVTLLNTAWEEVPFSFVVDWFYDIGGYLTQLKLNDIIAKSSVSVTEKGTTKTSSFADGMSFNLKGYNRNIVISEVVSLLAGYTSQYDSFYRSVGSLSVPAPSLEMGLYSLKRVLDSAALSWQKTRSFIKYEPVRPVRL